jgi:hypothetical protein
MSKQRKGNKESKKKKNIADKNKKQKKDQSRYD